MSRKLKDMQADVDAVLKKREKKKMGAPNFPYTEELALEICQVISTTPRSLEVICKQNPHFPGETLIREWAREKPDFGTMYAKAKDEQVDSYVNKSMEIIWDDSNDLLQTEGGLTGNGTAVARHRLQVDTIKWYASKLKRHKYGERSIVETKDITHEEGLESLDK